MASSTINTAAAKMTPPKAAFFVSMAKDETAADTGKNMRKSAVKPEARKPWMLLETRKRRGASPEDAQTARVCM
jgi:hypothetical protein